MDQGEPARHKVWGQLVPEAARWGGRGGERRDQDSRKCPPHPSSRPGPGGGTPQRSQACGDPCQQTGPSEGCSQHPEGREEPHWHRQGPSRSAFWASHQPPRGTPSPLFLEIFLLSQSPNPQGLASIFKPFLPPSPPCSKDSNGRTPPFHCSNQN